MTLLPGISSHSVRTDRLTVNVLSRPASPGSSPANAVVFVHGNVSSAAFWQRTMLALPDQISAYAVDLRGFGGTEAAPVDATRGLRDFSDDVAATVQALGLGAVHLVGWSMGGGVALQYAIDHPVLSLTLSAPVPPYGFGGTTIDGVRLSDDDAGIGGGGANPAFVANLATGDAEVGGQASIRSVYVSAYVAPGFVSADEELWLESMLTTVTGEDNYPGDSIPSGNWPGFAAGQRGVLNTMAPRYCDLSPIVDLEIKPPVLWMRGSLDAIVSDTSYFDLNYLGQVGVVPGWPGEKIAPAALLVSQTRVVLDRYAAAGGTYQELVFEECGHSPHLERHDEFVAALVAQVMPQPDPLDPA